MLPPVFGAQFYCFTNGTPCFQRVHFLTLFGGSPYLVLLGARPTVLGHNLEKYKSSERSSGEPANSWNHNSPDRLPLTTQTETKENWKFQLSPPKIFKTSEFWKLQQNFQIFSTLKDSSYSSQEKPAIQRLFENTSFCQGVSTRIVNRVSLRIWTTKPTVSI